MKFKIPKPLKSEHEELHAKLIKATKEPGEIGDAAKAVTKVLHHHFVKEEEYALSPLSLLELLVKGKFTAQMNDVLKMTDRLKKELPQMLKEHKAIVAKLKILVNTAKKGKKMEHAHFAQKLILHAKTEEEVLYPVAILIGEYIKMKTRSKKRS